MRTINCILFDISRQLEYRREEEVGKAKSHILGNGKVDEFSIPNAIQMMRLSIPVPLSGLRGVIVPLLIICKIKISIAEALAKLSF